MSKKSKNKNKKKQLQNKCPHCSSGPETFRYVKNMYRFDVDMARAFLADGRDPIELEPDDVRYSVDNTRIYPEHLEHVNLKYPGIIAHYWFPEKDGTILHGHLLIDGNHRAARSLQLGAPFFVQVLTEDESREILMEGPDIESILAEHALV